VGGGGKDTERNLLANCHQEICKVMVFSVKMNENYCDKICEWKKGGWRCYCVCCVLNILKQRNFSETSQNQKLFSVSVSAILACLHQELRKI